MKFSRGQLTELSVLLALNLIFFFTFIRSHCCRDCSQTQYNTKCRLVIQFLSRFVDIIILIHFLSTSCHG